MQSFDGNDERLNRRNGPCTGASVATAARGGTRLAGKSRQSQPGQPLVSVIVAVLNGAKSIETTIGSVLEQTYPNVELIVVDGGSTDGTVEVLRRLNDRIDYWISEPDTGIYDAWNKGVKLTAGDWIAFLGSDDHYQCDALMRYVEFISGCGRPLDYVSSRVSVQCANGIRRSRGTAWEWETFRVYMNVAHPGSLHHRRLFERFGEFDSSYHSSGDYEFLLRAGAELRAGFIDLITAEVLRGGVSDSVRALDEALRAKITTGGRAPAAARFEHYWARLKFAIRKALGF